MNLKVIAYARNGHTDKFGIPRQSRDESPILTRIVFEPEYNVREALRGIEGFSHLWLIWGFSEVQSTSTADAVRPSQSDCKTADAERPQDEPAAGLSWSPTVRPPRLGGNKRMGVFATRSPFRPNPIGLSSVRLLAVRFNEKLKIKNYESSYTHPESGRVELIVSGADVLDGTPIYDIKPYLSFSDSHEDAKNGFADETKTYRLSVDWSLISRQRLDNGSITARYRLDENFTKVKDDIEYILSQDPRPGYQDDPEREYKMDYAGWRTIFKVQSDKVPSDKVPSDKVPSDKVPSDKVPSDKGQGAKVVVLRIERISDNS